MAHSKNTQVHQTVIDSQLPSSNAVNVATNDIVDTRTPTPPSTSIPLHLESSEGITWVENNAVYYPFVASAIRDSESEDVVDTVQLQMVEIVTGSFLNAGALSHTMKFKVSDEDVATVKQFVKSGPVPSDTPDFYWFVNDGIAVASNKEELTSPFGEVYDGRNKAINDLDSDDLIPVHRIRPGVKVCVEFTPTL